MKFHSHQNYRLLLIPFLILTIACMCVPSGFLESSRNNAADTPDIPTEASDPTVEATSVDAAPSEEPVETPPLAETEETLGEADVLTETLSDGPYLILAGVDTLWVAPQDLSSIRMLASNVVLAQPLATLVSPDHQRIAVPVRENDGLALYVFATNGESPQRLDTLTHASLAAQPGDPDFEPMRVLTEQPTIAWAADSDHIVAVTNLNEGVTYLSTYSMSSADMVDITDFDGFAYAPHWSPDGKRIVFTTAETFGTGAGYAMKGIWQANPSTGEVSLVQDGAHSGGEEFLGWFDDLTAIYSSWSAVCGPDRIRKINLDTLEQEMVRKDCYVDAAADDEGGILYATGEHAYLLKPDKSKAEIIADGAFTQIDWTDDYMFVLRRQEAPLLTADRQGRDQQESPETPMDDVSQYGAIWGWTNAQFGQPGVWISGMGLDTQRIYSEAAYLPIWDPDNNLIFISQDQFWRATFDQMYTDPTPVTDVPGDILFHAWME